MAYSFSDTLKLNYFNVFFFTFVVLLYCKLNVLMNFVDGLKLLSENLAVNIDFIINYNFIPFLTEKALCTVSPKCTLLNVIVTKDT